MDLRHVLFAVALLAHAQAQDDPANSSIIQQDLVQDVESTPPAIIYYVTSPKTIRTYRDYPVSVTIQNASSPVNVNVQLVETFFQENDTILAEANGIFEPGTTQKFILKVAALEKTIGSNFYVRGQNQLLRIRGQDQRGNNFTDQSNQIVVERKNNLIFVQTDKPLYKLGDSVKFRVIVVDVALKPSFVPLDVKIYDPQRNLIQQHLQVNQPNGSSDLQAGFFAGEIQLASEAPLGEWSIEITSAEQDPTRKIFSVEEYVLPRFDVKIKAPAYIIALQDSFEVTITSNYTFGQPVKGQAMIQVDGPGKWVYEMRKEVRLSRNFVISEFNGTATVRVFVDDVVNKTDGFSDYSSITVSANVTEGTTNVQRMVLQSISMKKQPYKLDVIKSTNTFKPGFPYTVYVTATQHDGRPIPPTTRNLVVKISSSGSAFSHGYFDDEIKSYPVPVNGTVDITMVPAKETRNIFFKARLGKVTASTSIGGFDSPSNSFLQIYPNNKNISVGDIVSFDLRLTNPTSLLNFTVLSKGQIMTEGSVGTNGTSATVFFPVTQRMAPRARFLAYYMRPDSEVVANVIDFEVAGLLQNNVSISVTPENRTEYAEPGESALIRVQTAPNSFVGMLAMDQSLLLLKSGNDVTESDVTIAVQGFDSDSWSFDDAFGSSRFKFPDGRSVFRFLEQAGLIVLSNAAIPGNPKNPDVVDSTESYSGGAQSYGGGSMMMMSAPAAAMPLFDQQASSKRVVSSAAGSGDAPRLRQDFRETFLYETFPVGPSGVYEFSRPVPDTITSWVCSAFSLNSEVGLGVTKESSKLRVFRPFFAVLNLPFAIVRGETAQLQVLVFNYLDQDQEVLVTLEISGQDGKGNKFTALPRNKTMTVKAQDSASAVFPVKPEVVGEIEIKATAVSNMAGDALLKKLRVKPEGIRQQFNAPLFVDLRKQNRFSANVLIPLPKANIVPGSEKLVFSAIGDLLGPTIYGIDNLINLPHGCGEQNMALFAPNVFVMKYLASADRLDDNTKRKLLRNMRNGYQRQLTFRHYDKSYSAFGDTDPQGSTFLTAFVARSFLQAKDFITIDQEITNGALDWLVGHQAENGSFPEVGKVFDRELQGGAGKGTALTAYVLITLVEAQTMNEAKYASNITNAVHYLEAQIKGIINDPYALSIVNYALQLAGSNAVSVASNRLEALAVVGNGTKHWTKEIEVETQTFGKFIWEYRLPAKDIEMTAYALLSAIRSRKIDEGYPILAWLLTKRNQQGGFQTSQDTVVGLQAISEFAQMVQSKNKNLSVHIETDGYKKDLTIADANALVLQGAEPDKFYETVHVSASGTGTGLVQVSWIYYVRNTTGDQGFAVTTSIRKNTASIILQVCSRYQKQNSSNMAVMEINMPSGYQADEEEAKRLVGTVPELSRVDVEDEGTQVILYFDKISKEQRCVSITGFRMFTVDNLQDSNVVVYDYYNPKDRKSAIYNANKAH